MVAEVKVVEDEARGESREKRVGNGRREGGRGTGTSLTVEDTRGDRVPVLDHRPAQTRGGRPEGLDRCKVIESSVPRAMDQSAGNTYGWNKLTIDGVDYRR